MSLNILAWNNKIGHQCYFVGLRTDVMINRNSCGYSYSLVRGELINLYVKVYSFFIHTSIF